MLPHARLIIALFLVAVAFCALGVLAGARAQMEALRRLTNTPETSLSFSPSISGDGRRITFETTADLAGAGGSVQLRAIVADIGSEPPAFAQIAATRAPAPAISQDGSRITFAAASDPLGTNADRNAEIFLYDGAQLRQITNTAPADPALRAQQGSFLPSIADDGLLIVFSSNRDFVGRNADANFEIFLYDTAAQGFAQLTDTTGIAGATDAKISGDGSRIAFIRDNNAPEGEAATARDLMLYERMSGATRIIAAAVDNLALTYGRAISDDGRRVVYAGNTGTNRSQVFLYDERNGGVTRQITALASRVSEVSLHPTISGDGSRIAFAARRSVIGGNSDGSVELYLYDLPSAQFARLTDAPATASAEVISSLNDDGSQVVFNFPRVLSGPVSFPEFANNSEIYALATPARPPFSAASLTIINGASFGREPGTPKAVAPDSIAIARGTNLALAAAQTARQADRTFPREFGNTTVTVNGRAAQLFYVSPTEIRFHVPPEAATGTAEVIVRNHDGFETRGQATVAPAALGVFGQNGDGTGETVALDAMMLTPAPFEVDDAAGNARSVIVFATGARYASAITATIGGRAVAVEAVVAAPDLPGLDQVHIGLTPALRGAGASPLILRAGGRASNTTTVNIGGTRRAASIAIVPSSASIALGETVRFAATVRDEAGEILADAPIAFSVSDPLIASVDASGLATGLAPGVATIMASSGAVTASAELRVFNRTLVINEVLADPPEGLEGDANRDGTRSASQDEFIEIVNATEQDFDLSGYQLLTRATSGADIVRHTFAAGTIIPAGGCVVVFGGANPATFPPHHEAFGGAQVLLASTGGFSLTNTGSVVTLRAPSGEITDQMAYGSSVNLSGDRNQSLTRVPDAVGSFTLHLSAPDSNGRIFSPGTRAGGAPFVSPAIARIEIEPSIATITIGARQQFTARAFADDGRELSGVIFRWQSSEAAIAPVDSMGAATGLAAGAVEVTAAARSALSAPAQLTVREPERILTRIEITPAAAAIYTHGEQQFVARAFDQNGQEMSGVAFVWSASDESVAVVNQSGFAAARGAGETTIVATAQDASSGQAASGTATLSVIPPPLVINEFLADPPDGLAGDANRDGTRSGTEDEFIELVNRSSETQDISGWTIRARALAGTNETVRHTFAAGTTLAASDAIVIFGGGNFDPQHMAFGGAQIVRASSGGLSFANNGLTIIARDAANRIVAQVSYGTPPDDFGGDSVNQSIARSPDITGDFLRHTLAAGANGSRFSPGTRTDGSFFIAHAGRLTRIRLAPLTATVIETLTTEFAVQAFDQFDRPLRDASISFSASAAEIAAIETVNISAETGSATAIVRGLRAGVTEIRATATQGALSITSEPAQLTVTPAPPRVARIEVTPAMASINRGGTQQFHAQAYAHDGSLVTNASITWESSDTTIATVERTGGIARGIGLGEVSIRATAPDGASGATTTGEATLTVRLLLVINEILADVPPDNSATLQVEGDANRDGVRQADDDEFVEIVNNSDAPADISGVRLADATSNRFTFPAGTTLAGGQAAVIFGGGSPPASDPAFGGALIFTTGSLGLNDGGDTVTVKLTVGGAEIIIAAQSYGTSGGPVAPNDQSLTRSPDAESGARGGEFVAHSAATNANGRIFSPGTRADGAPFGSPPLTRIEIAPVAAEINTGETQAFAARAFSNAGGAEVEIPRVSFIWESSAASVAELSVATGAQTRARGNSAGHATITARAGGQQGAATLTVNAVVARIELSPPAATIAANTSALFTATARDTNGNALSGCSFTFSMRDIAPAGAAIITTTTADTVTVRGDQTGSATLVATCVRPGDGVTLEDTSTLTIIPPPPVPQPGEIIINEALVAFATSATQIRNDFIELYNTTEQARDISGLSLSFRPAGSGNTPRTITLPGAVGSGTTLIQPRSYFLIVNGAETFGAAADYDASTLGFDLNGTTGGIKIEINGAKLDGLTYHPNGSSPPAATFIQYGEGAAFTFSSGTTNDLIRSPNATDTDNNATDFSRNGIAASVSPKAANP